MAAPYTLRQGQFLAYIHTYTRLHRQPPSESEMAYFFGVSPPSVHQMVVTLERRGLLQRTPGLARALRVLLPPEALPNLDGAPPPVAMAAAYPRLAAWIGQGGRVELGRADDGPRPGRKRCGVAGPGELLWPGRAAAGPGSEPGHVGGGLAIHGQHERIDRAGAGLAEGLGDHGERPPRIHAVVHQQNRRAAQRG